MWRHTRPERRQLNRTQVDARLIERVPERRRLGRYLLGPAVEDRAREVQAPAFCERLGEFGQHVGLLSRRLDLPRKREFAGTRGLRGGTFALRLPGTRKKG